MSTMKVTNLKHESSSVNNIVLNSDGSVGGELGSTLASKLDLAGGKILQIVRATDSTDRSTTSTSFVDASISVTITPQKSDSAILVYALFHGRAERTASNTVSAYQITDASNNAISGGQESRIALAATGATAVSFENGITLLAYSTPATTSATTYKLRFSAAAGTTNTIQNSLSTGQMYAIEVSA